MLLDPQHPLDLRFVRTLASSEIIKSLGCGLDNVVMDEGGAFCCTLIR